MAWNVKTVGEVTGVPWVAGSEEGDYVGSDGEEVSATTEMGVGFIIDSRPTDSPPEMANAYGDGSVLEDTTASFTVDALLYSDGDGTISETQPAGTAGDIVTVVGVAKSATTFLVKQYQFELGA